MPDRDPTRRAHPAGRRAPGAAPAALLLLAALATAACGRASRPSEEAGSTARDAGAGEWRARSGEFLLGGVQVREPDRDRWLGRLAAAGFNSVALTVYATQGDWDGADLRVDDAAPWIADEARAAKAAGLRVVLVLRVALDHAHPRNRFLWHGMILPREDAQVGEWFDRYGEFVQRWAAVAEREGVDVLGIGSELNALASTRPVAGVPALEAYYLDPRKQEERRRRAGRFAAQVDRRHLHGSWQETYDSLPRYLADEIEAQRRWAEQVAYTGGGARAEDAVAAINRRRARLEREWSELIAAVRAVYGGELTYAANFDQFREVGFWPDLDLLGINAYFPLRLKPRGDAALASLEPEMEASWRRVLEDVAAFRGEIGAAATAAPATPAAALPVLFTELGYTARVDSTVEPWSSRGFSLVGDWEEPQLVVWEERESSFEERALAVRALHRATSEVDPDLLRGLLWWKLSTVSAHQAIEPFVLLIGEDAPPDPLLVELRKFREP